MNLESKTIFVTAAAQGIGRAIAEVFVSAGAKVTATDVNLPLLYRLSMGLKLYNRTLQINLPYNPLSGRSNLMFL